MIDDLDNTTLHLWVADVEAFEIERLETQTLAWLDGEARRRYTRLVPAAARRQFLLTRRLLREVLSSYRPEVDPGHWRFVTNAYGKPALGDGQQDLNLHFNLSHSGSRVVLALGRHRDLGVDIEFSDRPRRVDKIAERYFSRLELADLLRLDEVSRLSRFYELWTLKEAYIKACGKGLLIPLRDFSFRFPTDDRLSLEFETGYHDDVRGWQVWQLALSKDYALALACRQDPKQGIDRIASVKIHQFGEPSAGPPQFSILRRL